MDNIKHIHEIYPEYRKYPTLGINAHISVTPPLPYKFYIHQEGLEKTWSAVTYITPDKNIGTKMYTAQDESAFVKEAQWQPNSTFIFCGKQNTTWHSYESNQDTNRITFNPFNLHFVSISLLPTTGISSLICAANSKPVPVTFVIIFGNFSCNSNNIFLKLCP